MSDTDTQFDYFKLIALEEAYSVGLFSFYPDIFRGTMMLSDRYTQIYPGGPRKVTQVFPAWDLQVMNKFQSHLRRTV